MVSNPLSKNMTMKFDDENAVAQNRAYQNEVPTKLLNKRQPTRLRNSMGTASPDNSLRKSPHQAIIKENTKESEDTIENFDLVDGSDNSN